MEEIEMNNAPRSVNSIRGRLRLGILLTTLGVLALSLFLIKRQTGFFRMPVVADANLIEPPEYAAQSQILNPNQEQLANAKLSILFVGNSHTGQFNLAQLVLNLINDRLKPAHAVAIYHSVSFLDEAANDEALLSKIESGKWNAIVLQAQKISSSGKYRYPVEEGVRLAKHSLVKGCPTYFYSEWGIQGVPDHARFTENVYQSMADESGAQVIPVGRVWEAVFRDDPDIGLYSDDKNHQSRLGASLTALTIASYLLDEPASVFAEFHDPVANPQQWKGFVEKVVKVQAEFENK